MFTDREFVTLLVIVDDTYSAFVTVHLMILLPLHVAVFLNPFIFARRSQILMQQFPFALWISLAQKV